MVPVSVVDYRLSLRQWVSQPCHVRQHPWRTNRPLRSGQGLKRTSATHSGHYRRPLKSLELELRSDKTPGLRREVPECSLKLLLVHVARREGVYDPDGESPSKHKVNHANQ